MSDKKGKGIKLLISGLPMSGKTSLLQTLENVLVIARDGKKYPFQQPHTNVPDFSHSTGSPISQSYISTINSTIKKYKEKFGKLPDTLAIDSFSKIVLDIENEVVKAISSFPYGVVNQEINNIVSYIESTLIGNGINVVIVSHAMRDEEEGLKLVNAGGSYGKKGGVISETDEAIFVSANGNKRTIYYKSNAYLSRSLIADLPEKANISEFNLQKHLELLQQTSNKATEYEL